MPLQINGRSLVRRRPHDRSTVPPAPPPSPPNRVPPAPPPPNSLPPHKVAAKLRKLILSMKKTLTCRICLSTYDKPTMLNCGHSFCRRCIARLLSSNITDVCVKCPLCNRHVFCPPSTLTTNVALAAAVDDLARFEQTNDAASTEQQQAQSNDEADEKSTEDERRRPSLIASDFDFQAFLKRTRQDITANMYKYIVEALHDAVRRGNDQIIIKDVKIAQQCMFVLDVLFVLLEKHNIHSVRFDSETNWLYITIMPITRQLYYCQL